MSTISKRGTGRELGHIWVFSFHLSTSMPTFLGIVRRQTLATMTTQDADDTRRSSEFRFKAKSFIDKGPFYPTLLEKSLNWGRYGGPEVQASKVVS